MRGFDFVLVEWLKIAVELASMLAEFVGRCAIWLSTRFIFNEFICSLNVDFNRKQTGVKYFHELPVIQYYRVYKYSKFAKVYLSFPSGWHHHFINNHNIQIRLSHEQQEAKKDPLFDEAFQ